MLRIHSVRLSLAAGLLIATSSVAPAETKVLSKTATGKPDIKSINVLGFAPEACS